MFTRAFLNIRTSISACLIVSLALLFADVHSAQAQTAEEFFILGNRAYSAGDYKKAEENFDQALEKGGNSAQLHFNLANTCAKLDKRGKALLNYLRSIYIEPRLREASANLKVFADENSLALPMDKFSAPFVSELSHSEWLAIAFASFWAAVLLIFIPPLYGKKSVAWIFLAIVSASIFALSSMALFDWKSYASTAIADKNDTPMLVSPVEDAPVIAMLHEGQIASILNRHGNFIYVETPSGKRGWAASDKFIPVVE